MWASSRVLFVTQELVSFFFLFNMALFLGSLQEPWQRNVTGTTSLSHSLVYAKFWDIYTNRFIFLGCCTNILQKQIPSHLALLAKCKSRNQDRLNWSYNFITIHLVPTIFRRKKKNLTCGFTRLLTGDAFVHRLTAGLWPRKRVSSFKGVELEP